MLAIILLLIVSSLSSKIIFINKLHYTYRQIPLFVTTYIIRIFFSFIYNKPFYVVLNATVLYLIAIICVFSITELESLTYLIDFGQNERIQRIYPSNCSNKLTAPVLVNCRFGLNVTNESKSYCGFYIQNQINFNSYK